MPWTASSAPASAVPCGLWEASSARSRVATTEPAEALQPTKAPPPWPSAASRRAHRTRINLGEGQATAYP
jgi:hypothetical protein